MVKQIYQERRGTLRAKRVLSIQFRRSHPRNAENFWNLSTTQDMSISGLTFYTDQEYHRGDMLEVNVAMSGVLDIFKGLAKVVRVERKKTGVYYFVAVQFIQKHSAQNRNAKSFHPAKRSAKRHMNRIKA